MGRTSDLTEAEPVTQRLRYFTIGEAIGRDQPHYGIYSIRTEYIYLVFLQHLGDLPFPF